MGASFASLTGQRTSQREQLACVLEVLEPALDIVTRRSIARAAGVVSPARLGRLPAEARRRSAVRQRTGWLRRGARRPPVAPSDLRELAAGVSRCTRLPSLGTSELAVPAAALRGVAARKRGQLAVLLGALPTLASHADRIVDVGGGRGHFAWLASELFQRRALALDRDASLLMSGIERSAALSRETKALGVEFVEVDIGRQPLELQSNDLAVGLHACGELGDRVILAACAAGCDVALVSCCFQKTSSSTRAPLSRAARGLEIRRGALGLANLAPRDDGVEATLADNFAPARRVWRSATCCERAGST